MNTKDNSMNMDQVKKHMNDQLWSMYIDTEKHFCIGILEISEGFFKEKKPIDFDEKMPLAYLPLQKLPENEEASANIILDITNIAACPNIYLLLEAIHENKPESIADFHLKAFYKFKKNSSGKIRKLEFASLDRTNKKCNWTANNNGYVINHYGQKLIKFIDPKLAQWVSLVSSQFYNIASIDAEQRFGVKKGKYIPGGAVSEVDELMSAISYLSGQKDLQEDTEVEVDYKKLKQDTREDYLKMKELLKDTKWNINENLKNMNIFVE